MQRILSTIGWLLVATAGILLLVSPFVASSAFDPLKNALPAGVLVALAGNLLTQAKNLADANEKRSAFHLEFAIKAYEQAKSLIEDGNNDRAKWIECGRCLGHAKALGEGVTFDAHQRVLEFNRLKYRSYFAELLVAKSAAFFYGSSVPDSSLDEAAKEATAPEDRHGRRVASTNKALDESSVRAVWEAAQWPSDYQHPLGGSFSEPEREKLILLFPGLHGYFQHRARWHSAAGQLHPRRNGDGR